MQNVMHNIYLGLLKDLAVTHLGLVKAGEILTKQKDHLAYTKGNHNTLTAHAAPWPPSPPPIPPDESILHPSDPPPPISNHSYNT
ncbi:hypothetical protein CROQUDRAFT_100792 [Cronartium quercuum f. sp. fusiforme G11]|uniref:Uncharacterized protein n=1 Tax=Cronartium quercuum f. sp. fusiforme G11 TaxID=708437 RepID=A0A9P6T5Q6_9BASI|nr:hypothetical protein CROQUDRAFT_100792 [Cronartium quercuum f. sp. fusiforme G11]